LGPVQSADRRERLNKLFEDYDVVLYELVAPKGTKIPKGGKKGSADILTLGREIMKRFLALEDQLQKVDYTKDNFVHADMSPLELKKAMESRGDTQETILLHVFLQMMKQQNATAAKGEAEGEAAAPEASLEDLLQVLTDENASVKLKRMMAGQFANMEDPNNPGNILSGGPIGQLLIDDRNGAAVEVLIEQMKKGKKKIAIFYGAAHLPDFEKRIMTQFNLQRESITWVPAWDLRD